MANGKAFKTYSNNDIFNKIESLEKAVINNHEEMKVAVTKLEGGRRLNFWAATAAISIGVFGMTLLIAHMFGI